MNNHYQICARCVMDTSDPDITFDDAGVCNHCTHFDQVTSKNWYPGDKGKAMLEDIVAKVREAGRDQEYDCILGLSGGVDSSYLAIKIKELGLRPLVVHVDAGWNSELAVSNIEKIVKYCNFELHTHVMDWSEMRDLQLAYFRSGIANQDVPQDHAFFSSLYHFAIKNKIKTVFSGGNIATESIFPDAWHGSAMDATNLKAIHLRFGKSPLRHYKTISFFQYYFWYPFIKKMKVIRLLDYMNFNKDDAISELENLTGWRSYSGKHGESLFTRFFQNYYLPEKFGYDKRKPHLSSLIVSGQLTRDEAIELLEAPSQSTSEREMDINYFCKKVCITRNEFDSIMEQGRSHYKDYPNWDSRYLFMKKLQRLAERLTGKRYNAYS